MERTPQQCEIYRTHHGNTVEVLDVDGDRVYGVTRGPDGMYVGRGWHSEWARKSRDWKLVKKPGDAPMPYPPEPFELWAAR